MSNETKRLKAASEFVSRANLIHNNKYSYELVDYVTSKLKVKITCPSHGPWEQTPANHLRPQSCPLCALAESGWSRTSFKEKCEKNNNGLGILYILECFSDNESFIKIGITSKSIKERYSSLIKMPYNYKVLHELVADPEVIYDLETLLHKKSKHYKYTPITSFAGSSTECFLSDNDYMQKLNTYINKLNNIQIRSNNAE